MFGISNTMGITIDKKCRDNLKEENKKLLNVFLKIYELILDKDLEGLRKAIPNIQISQIIGKICTKEKWLDNLKNEDIKYYGIDIIDVKVKNERIGTFIKSSNYCIVNGYSKSHK